MSDNEIVGEFLVESYENLDQQRSDCRAADDDQLGWLQEQFDDSVLHQVPAQYRPDHHHDSDDYEHNETALRPFEPRLVPRR